MTGEGVRHSGPLGTVPPGPARVADCLHRYADKDQHRAAAKAE